jgi:uncharacterized protein
MQGCRYDDFPDLQPVSMARIHIADLEAAINYWRALQTSANGVALAPELGALAEVYALLAFRHAEEMDEDAFPAEARRAWLAWYDSTPDTPCIAVCSTAQCDAICKGCGRSFDEVQHWPAMSPAQKRQVWRRIIASGQAWRFNRYAERAGGDRQPVSRDQAA